VSGSLRRRASVAAVAAFVMVQLSCVAALAAPQGVALDTGRITVETPLVGGKSYSLARLGVRNPGTQRMKYDLVVTPVRTDAQSPQPAWFSFSPKQVTVQPGKQTSVTVSLRVPKGAAAGQYEVLVGARVAADGGMAIAAAAAARLTFTVAPSGTPGLSLSIPALWPIPTAALLVGGWWLSRRRSQSTR
jgi:hypothetical protein